MFDGLLVSYRTDDGWKLGALEGNSIAPLTVPGAELHSHMRSPLSHGPGALQDVLAEAARKISDGTGMLPLGEVDLGPTVPGPDKILCVGFNYDGEGPAAPNTFAQFRHGLTSPQARLPLPAVSTEVDYEGELAVIIGQRCKATTVEDALSYVAGYTVANDVSARDLQFRTSQWTLGKALDGFFPLGPGLAPASRVGNPQCRRLVTNVNARTVARQQHQGNGLHRRPADRRAQPTDDARARRRDQYRDACGRRLQVQTAALSPSRRRSAGDDRTCQDADEQGHRRRIDRYGREHPAGLAVHGSN
jgi:2-keto-4-pentenoate hydratase/2-oxohepta-3-ene-1,7-dioic acid hydratase in catechol pathway